MVRVLVTGGIGSGKSYVCRVLKAMGIPVYDADMAVKRLYDEDAELLRKIQGIAGESVVVDGKLDRKALAKRLFTDATLKHEIESVVFPAVIDDFKNWCSCQIGKIAILESAIALENESLRCMYDNVISVVAPMNVRIERAMRRDGSTYEQILSRINNQWSDEDRSAVADYIVINDSETPLLPQLESLFMNLKKICQ